MAPNTMASSEATRLNPGHSHLNPALRKRLQPQLETQTETETEKVTSVNERGQRVKEAKGKGQVKEILYDGFLYDITDFVKKHPGGGVIEFYTQCMEDATHSIDQMHGRALPKVMAIMKHFKKRPAPLSSLAVNEATLLRHKALSEDFVQLYREFEAEGLFEASIYHAIYRVAELIILFLLASYFLFPYLGERTLMSTSAGVMCLALFATRCGYVGHETGHYSLTGKKNVDSIIELLVFGWGSGLSASCWNNQHNIHHDMPQRLDRDHELRTLPLIAFNEKLLKPDKNQDNFFVRNQAILSLPFDTLMVYIYWKYWLHPLYAWRNGKDMELLCMCIHTLYVTLFVGFWPYFFSIWLGSMYLFGNYALSHLHLPVTDGPLHWVEYGLMHTQDIDSSWWIDWWMGYLNTQIEHHLFPLMPQYKTGYAKERVIALAKKHNIPYLCSSYSEIVLKSFKNLQRVSNHLHHH